MPEVQQLFAQGNLALLANAGTLVQPVTLAQYNAGTVALPPQLFSHADQQVQWQSSVPDQPFQTGWGGRLADIVNALNTNPKISMSISVAGENCFQVGNTVSQFAVNPTGAVVLSGMTGNTVATQRFAAQQNILNQQEQNLFQAAFGGMTTAAIADSQLLNSVLAAAPKLPTVFPATSIGSQLQMIAQMIASAPQLGLKRQIFFASLGGFDLHSDELTAHATLLSQLSQALSAFYTATVELGVQNQVTTFTASDFSRTFNTNGRRRERVRPRLGQPPHDHGRSGQGRRHLRPGARPGAGRPRRHGPRPLDSDDERGRIRRDPRDLVRREPHEPPDRAPEHRALRDLQPGFHGLKAHPAQRPDYRHEEGGRGTLPRPFLPVSPSGNGEGERETDPRGVRCNLVTDAASIWPTIMLLVDRE